MANNNISFSVRLQAFTDDFNRGIDKAARHFGSSAQKMDKYIQTMERNAKVAANALNHIEDSTPDKLTQALNKSADELRKLGAGAKISEAQLTSAFEKSGGYIDKLNKDLKLAKLNLDLLKSTNAPIKGIEVASLSVAELTTKIKQASEAQAKFGSAAKNAMREAKASTNIAKDALYDLLNLKTDSQIRKQISEINVELRNFQKNSGKPAEEIRRVTQEAEKQIRSLENELKGLNDVAAKTDNQLDNLDGRAKNNSMSFGNFKKQLIGFGAAYVGINEVVQGLRAVVDTAKQLDSLNQKLEYATGSAEAAADKYGELKEVANALGLEQIDLANGYAQLAAAGKQINLTSAEIDTTFRGVADAAAAMSLTAEEANGVFLAVSQIAGKGKVSMEELRQQLGERLTPAMGIAAEAMGVTVAELDKLVSSGNLAAKDFLPKFGAALSDSFGGQAAKNIDTMTGKLNVMKNQFTDLKEKLGNGLVGDGVVGGLDTLSNALEKISQGIDDIDPAMIDAISETFSNAFGVASEFVGQFLANLGEVNTLIGDLSGSATNAEESVGLLTRSLQGISIILGALKDGMVAIGIATDLVVGAVYKIAEAFARGQAQMQLFNEDAKAELEAQADYFAQQADRAFTQAQDGAMNFESATKKSLNNAIGQGQAQLQALADAAKKSYDDMVAAGGYSTEELKIQWLDYAQKSIAANDGVATEQLRVEAAQRGIGIAALESADKFEQGAGLSKEALAGLAEVGEATGASLEVGLARALNAANNKAEIDLIIDRLMVLQAQGKITAEELAQGVTKANARYVELGDTAEKAAEKAAAAKDAFLAYAQEQIKANDGVISKQLENEATLKGYKVALNEMGEVAVTAWDKTKQGASDASTATKEAEFDLNELNKTLGLGLSAAYIKSKEGFDKLIGQFDDLRENGTNAAQLVEQSLKHMIEKAKNTDEITDLTELIVQMGKEGKIAGQDLSAVMDLAREKTDKLTEGINSANEAYAFLNIKTKEQYRELADTAKVAYEKITADATASKEAIITATETWLKYEIGANGGVIKSTHEVIAAKHGLKVEVDKLGRAVVTQMTDAAKATANVKNATDHAASGYEEMGNAAESASNRAVAASSRNVQALEKEIKTLQQRDELLSKARGAKVNSANNLNGVSMKAYSQANIEERLRQLDRYKDEKGNVNENKVRTMAKNIFDGFVDSQKGLAHWNPNFRMTNADYVDEQIKKLSGYSNKNSKLGMPSLDIGNAKVGMPAIPERTQKTVNMNLNFNGKSINAQVPSAQESDFIEMMQMIKNRSA